MLGCTKYVLITKADGLVDLISYLSDPDRWEAMLSTCGRTFEAHCAEGSISWHEDAPHLVGDAALVAAVEAVLRASGPTIAVSPTGRLHPLSKAARRRSSPRFCTSAASSSAAKCRRSQSRLAALPDVTDDVDDLDNSNCSKCLVPFAIARTDERPFWRCPECGLVQL